MEKQSEKEMKLHRKFKFWDEATTISRYFIVLFLGLAFYDFSFDTTFYLFVLSILVNGLCYYSMMVTFDNIVKERIKHNNL